MFAGVIDTSGKFATGLVDTGVKFAAGVVDPGGKFVTRVIDTVGAPSLANISADFWKKLEITLMLFSGAWGKTIHEKNLKQKSCDTVSLNLKHYMNCT